MIREGDEKGGREGRWKLVRAHFPSRPRGETRSKEERSFSSADFVAIDGDEVGWVWRKGDGECCGSLVEESRREKRGEGR